MTTATTTPTMDERIAQRRAALAKQRAERKDGDDLPRTMTTREVNAYLAVTATLDRQIAALNMTVDTLAAVPSIEPDTRWRDHLTEWRAIIDAELLAMHPRVRNKEELELQQRLTFSLRLIDIGFAASRLPGPIISLASTRVGELMAAAGYDTVGLELLRGANGFRGSLPDVEKRIKDLTKQRTAAQAALDLLLRTDEEKAQADAESALLRDAFNAMHCTYGPDGHVAHDDYGDVLEKANMTDVQRRSIERMDAIEREYRQSVIDRQSGRG